MQTGLKMESSEKNTIYVWWKLRKVKFKYSGLSIENVLDKLPTAKILNEKDGIYTIRAEVYGEGFKMWARSQGESIFDIE